MFGWISLLLSARQEIRPDFTELVRLRAPESGGPLLTQGRHQAKTSSGRVGHVFCLCSGVSWTFVMKILIGMTCEREIV